MIDTKESSRALPGCCSERTVSVRLPLESCIAQVQAFMMHRSQAVRGYKDEEMRDVPPEPESSLKKQDHRASEDVNRR